MEGDKARIEVKQEMSSKPKTTATRDEIRIGISACILGDKVRFDGGHKLDRFIRDTFGAYVRFVPVCPEVGIKLGIPRETLRLVQERGSGELPRLLAAKSGTDRTQAMLDYSSKRVGALKGHDLCGFILQNGSPTCGMERVRVYPPGGGQATKSGRGLFARVLINQMPNLPVEEDGRLNDARLRENFIERVFAYRRLKSLFSGRWKMGDLVSFHTREKLLVLAHDRSSYQALGRLVATAKKKPRAEVAEHYEHLLLAGLKRIATIGKHTNVLSHIAGFCKKLLDGEDRHELHQVIDNYRKGLVPLVVPITLVRHHIRRHCIEYLEQQTYLDPHPIELMLRNHV
jgi:uncharacterized protein YbgA (DUF1722 family)/uncharacterized protein YbbK (DUF523 family)